MNIKWIITFTLGALAVGIGAFGAHALNKYMDDYSKGIFETGSKYHFYHVLFMIAILIIASWQNTKYPNSLNYAWICSLAGIILFSGSLYLLATKELHAIPTKILGPITPLGGLFFIAAWILMIVFFLRK